MAYTTTYSVEPTTAGDSAKLPLYWSAVPYPPGATYQANFGDKSLPQPLNKIYASIEAYNAANDTDWFVEGGVVKNHKAGSAATYTTATISDTAGATVVETTKEAQGFSVTLSVPALYAFSQTSGYAPSHKVEVGIYYKKIYELGEVDPAPNEWNCIDPSYVISSEATRSEILKEVSTHPTKLPLARYKVLVVRNSEDHTGSFDFADDVYVKELKEILYEELSYPHTALLGLKIRATDQLSGSPPTVTSLVRGTKVSVPTNLIYGSTVFTYNPAGYSGIMGSMSTTKVWTNNPVWCLYDLLTNKRYGLGDYYKINPDKLGLMQANFYLMAKYCDELVASTDENDPANADPTRGVVAAHTRPRFTLNMVLDQTKPATEWVSAIAAIMRASVFYSEGIFWLDIDRPKLTTQIFTMANMRDYSQTGTSYRAIPNTFEVQWINPKASYEIDVFRLESEEFRLNQALEERKKALLLLGVTNFDQAKALGKYALYAGMYRTKLITFKTHTGGLRSMVGDVVGVQHDVPQWGWGGKITHVEDVTGGYRLTLSSPFDYQSPAAGLTLTLCPTGKSAVEMPVLSPVYGAGQTVVTVANTHTVPDPVTGTPVAVVPAVGDSYIVGLASNAINLFKIASIKRDTDEFVEIMAVEYDPQLYDKCDDTSDLGAWVSTDYSLLTTPTRSSVSGVTAETELYQDAEGVFKTRIRVFYDPPRASTASGSDGISTFWRAAEIWYAPVGSTAYTLAGTSTNGSFVIEGIHGSGAYQIVVCSVYSSGKQSVQDALNDSSNAPYTRVQVDAYAPNDNFLKGVTGLEIVNQANNNTFTGKDCVVRWKKPLAVDAAVTTTAGGTAGTTVDTWFKHYQVTVHAVSFASEDTEFNDPIIGVIKRTAQVSDEKFVYTHEMNHQDAPVSRHFNVTVVAYDRLWRASAPKTILCSNPAPPAIG